MVPSHHNESGLLSGTGSLVGRHVVPDFEASAFRTFGHAKYFEMVQQLIGRVDEHFLQAEVADAFCASTKQLSYLCRSVPEIEYIACMNRIASLAVADPVQGMLSTPIHSSLLRVAYKKPRVLRTFFPVQ